MNLFIQFIYFFDVRNAEGSTLGVGALLSKRFVRSSLASVD
jgi:hypothetical protein